IRLAYPAMHTEIPNELTAAAPRRNDRETTGGQFRIPPAVNGTSKSANTEMVRLRKRNSSEILRITKSLITVSKFCDIGNYYILVSPLFAKQPQSVPPRKVRREALWY